MKFPRILTTSIASRLLAPWHRPALATLAACALALTLVPREAAADFSGAFAPANFTLTNTNANGSVNIAGAPGSISITGGNGGFTGEGNTTYTLDVPASGRVGFNWAFTTPDGPSFDPFGYVQNGTFVQVTNNFGLQSQNGAATFSIAAGQPMGFQVRSVDNVSGASTTTVSNFLFSDAVYWKGSTNGLWTGANWTLDAAGTVATAQPDAPIDVVFSATGAANQTTTLGQDFTIHGLTIQDPAAVTIGGANTLTTLGAAGTGVDVQSGAGLFTMNAGLTLGGLSDTVAVNNTSGARINGVVGGVNRLIKTGSGTLTLAGVNSYSGGTTVRFGTLALANGGAISHVGAPMIVGRDSGDVGALNVTGGFVSNTTGYLGFNAGSNGTATISGGTWSNGASSLVVGFKGNGTLNVTGGEVTNTSGYLGFDIGSQGTATISGGTWNNSGELRVGNFGAGTLNVSGGTVLSVEAYIAAASGSSGTATMSSGTWNNIGDGYLGTAPFSSGTATVSGGTWSNTGELFVGWAGNAGLNVTGGTVSNLAGFLGYHPGSSGVATVSSGTWNNSGALHVGFTGTGTLGVTGGTVISNGGGIGWNGGSHGTASISSGTWTNSGFLYVGVAGDGILNIYGGTVTSGSLSVAEYGTSNSGTVTIQGAGAALTLTGAGTTIIGANAASTAVLNVRDGGTFTSGTGTVTLKPTGAINIDGGIVTLAGPLLRYGGALHFNTGALSIVDPFTVGTGGLLGVNVTFDATRRFTTTATTTIDAFRTLTLDGGTFSTGGLVNNGTLDFRRGTLAITGTAGFHVGIGALGANVTLGTGTHLQVTQAVTVASGASLTLDGGSLTAGTLYTGGPVQLLRGALTIGDAVINGNNTDFSAARPFSVGGVFTNEPGARLTLQNGSGRVSGTGSISNFGLIAGDGAIDVPVTNGTGAEIRGEAGKTLTFNGVNGTNSGRINLLGGTVQFTRPLTNGAAGQINGEGVIVFPTAPVPSSGSPTAGLDNAGRLSFSGGDTQVYGTVQMLAGSRLIASGGATATFYDVFRHNGAEVKASAGSALVFFGEVRGAGSFTGTGTVYLEGGYSPGNSPAAVTLDTDLIFGDAATLTLELGGLTAGSGYDQLVLGANGSLALDGALVLDFIAGFTPAAGDTFAVFDFAPGQITGGFDEILFADALPAGLSFDTTRLTTTGRIGVIPEPGSIALFLGGIALLGFRRPSRK